MPDFAKICRSSQFTFLAGDDKIPVKIYSAVVKDHSKPLNALISNGVMQESTASVAVLADVDPEVFTAFCEYAYTGTYTSPFTLPVNNEGKITLFYMISEVGSRLPSIIHHLCTDIADRAVVQLVEKYMIASSKMSNLCTVLCGTLLKEFQALIYGAEPSPLHGMPCTLFHAKLYVFATKYLVEPLRQKCLRSIHRDLSTYLLKTDDMCDLLDYVYRETGPVEPDGRSPMRNMLVIYVAARIWYYSMDKRFIDTLQSNGELGADLIPKLTL